MQLNENFQNAKNVGTYCNLNFIIIIIFFQHL